MNSFSVQIINEFINLILTDTILSGAENKIVEAE